MTFRTENVRVLSMKQAKVISNLLRVHIAQSSVQGHSTSRNLACSRVVAYSSVTKQ